MLPKKSDRSGQKPKCNFTRSPQAISNENPRPKAGENSYFDTLALDLPRISTLEFLNLPKCQIQGIDGLNWFSRALTFCLPNTQ